VKYIVTSALKSVRSMNIWTQTRADQVLGVSIAALSGAHPGITLCISARRVRGLPFISCQAQKSLQWRLCLESHAVGDEWITRTLASTPRILECLRATSTESRHPLLGSWVGKCCCCTASWRRVARPPERAQPHGRDFAAVMHAQVRSMI
jgi:hypothetical protein